MQHNCPTRRTLTLALVEPTLDKQSQSQHSVRGANVDHCVGMTGTNNDLFDNANLDDELKLFDCCSRVFGLVIKGLLDRYLPHHVTMQFRLGKSHKLLWPLRTGRWKSGCNTFIPMFISISFSHYVFFIFFFFSISHIILPHFLISISISPSECSQIQGIKIIFSFK